MDSGSLRYGDYCSESRSHRAGVPGSSVGGFLRVSGSDQVSARSGYALFPALEIEDLTRMFVVGSEGWGFEVGVAGSSPDPR